MDVLINSAKLPGALLSGKGVHLNHLRRRRVSLPPVESPSVKLQAIL
jgi:hypothetical protein